MQPQQSAEAQLIARSLDPTQVGVLLQILASEPIEDGEGTILRMRGLTLHLLGLLRRNKLLAPIIKTRPYVLIELERELEGPMTKALPSRMLKRRLWECIIELVEAAHDASTRVSLSTVRQQIIALSVELLTQKCLSMSLRALRDFRLDQRMAFLRETLALQNPAYAKLVTRSLVERYIIPIVTQNLKDLGHYVKIRQPVKAKKKPQSDTEKGGQKACAFSSALDSEPVLRRFAAVNDEPVALNDTRSP